MNDREACEVAQVHRRHHALGVQATDVASPSSAAGWLAGAGQGVLRVPGSERRPPHCVLTGQSRRSGPPSSQPP